MKRLIRRAGTTAGTALVVLAVAACGLPAQPSPHSTISAGPDRLRTFSVIHAVNGIPVACGLPNVEPRVVGTLEGDASAREPIWLRSADARRLSVVWPQGFTVKFEPAAVLYNDHGVAVAGAGQSVELSQVRLGTHAGTFDDPYIASGVVFGECYVFLP